MKLSMNRRIDECFALLKSILYCIHLSWSSSHLYTILCLLLRTIQPLVNLVNLFVSKRILDILASPDATCSYVILVMCFSIVALAAILKIVIEKVMAYVDSNLSENVSKTMTMNIMSIAIHADVSVYDVPKSYDRLEMAVNNKHSVVQILLNVMSMISCIFTLIVAIAMLTYNNFLYSLVLLLSAMPSAVISTCYTKRLYLLDVEQMNKKREQEYYYETATNKDYSLDIRLHNIGEILKNRYELIWKVLFTQKKKHIKRQAMFTIFMTCLSEIVSILLLIDVSRKILDGVLSIGNYTLYGGLISQIQYALSMVIYMGTMIYDNRLRLDNLRDVKTISESKIKNGKLELAEVETIEFRNVSFSYPNSSKMVLDNLNLTITKGERVAIVGINGSGKSTMIKLLLRFYLPSKGDIYINNKNIAEYDIQSMRNAFCCYFQNSRNYALTLRDNLEFASIRRTQNEADMIKAIEYAGGRLILGKAGSGIDTYITRLFRKDGIELSIGEQQIISLSRTLYRNASIVILDEPTSSLDPEAEIHLFDNLLSFCKTKTALFTCHRLSNLQLATRIIVLENGKIQEDGTLCDLLSNSTRFREIYEKQAKKYSTM